MPIVINPLIQLFCFNSHQHGDDLSGGDVDDEFCGGDDGDSDDDVGGCGNLGDFCQVICFGHKFYTTRKV